MKVEYRNMPHGGGKISTIGIGAGSLHESRPQEIKDVISYGMEHGINLIDTVMYDSSAVEPIEQALKGQRDEMIMQMHLGAVYPKEHIRGQGFFQNLREGLSRS
ncbi:aldo-keto reductase family protein [Methanosarcina barkeri]|uniref:hypothetical protein n=1 Tax=Methanosarcina barkeri TaxID=2208 RepID=UPI000AB4855C|nr:hypothetical protein [Methanosarcina barkeri]